MKSPRHMRIIEIDITNACNKRCSNCTRLCGHYRKPYFMNFDTFRRAVDSLDGYQGIRSLMGGEPTLHPEFERFIRYLGSKFPPRKSPMIYPQKEFIKAIHREELNNFQLIDDGVERVDIIGAGMFSNMGGTYKKYYEIINDVMPFQGLNDHLNPVYHQSALITRKDLGIPDKEWHLLRDACWLQNEWSAGITPKGAFFCEIAGVLDMLFDGPGGWPIEPGWWKREPTDFGDQLRWCELCGFALDTFTRDSSEEIDDVSPTMYEMLKKVESPKLKSGRINVIKIVNGTISDESKKENKRFSPSMPYIERYEDRFNALNSVLFTHEYEFAVIPDGDDFGVKFNKLLAAGKEWIVLHSANVRLTDDFCEQMSKFVLNPGTMHYIDLSKSNDARFVKNADQENTGYAALFCKNAISLREFGFDRIAHTMSFAEIIDMWQRHKVIELSSSIDAANKRPELCPGMKFAIWGTGSAGCVAFDLITGAGGEVVAAVDRDISRHGGDFYGVKIQAPEQLLADGCEFDLLIAANYTRFAEIKREAVAMGIEEAKIEYLTIVCQNAEKIKVAQVACPICGANDIETTKRESVYKCCSCRHVWRHNVTGTDAALEDRYSEAKYWAQDKNHQGITGISYSEEWDNWLNSRLDLLENMGLLMVEDPKKVSVFEFGCSEGMLLHALKRRGFEVLGNDVCGIIEKSQEALGITILPGPIEKLCLSQKFDLIMSFHVMEHLNDPVYVAEKLAAYLKPGGKMLFMVPTGESEIDNLDHIHLFSRESLRVFMGKFTEVINERLQSYTTPNGMTHEVITILGQKAGCAGKGLG